MRGLERSPALPERLLDEVIATRRDIHRHPELGFKEYRTAGIVGARLGELGYAVTSGIAETGVVGILHGSRPGRTIMLRADMDALPLQEETGLPFSSARCGSMHACGHDGHVAMLLGAARAIAERKDDLSGAIVLCFQPAEEGAAGAQRMVESGLLERFGIERSYGLHLDSAIASGTFGFCEGPMCAANDAFEICIAGVGGHASAPHRSIDPILTAAEFLTLVQRVVSRHVDPLQPAVLTVGSISSGTTHNVIPGTATMLGTVRAFDASVCEKVFEQVERVLRCVCESAGAVYSLRRGSHYPVTANDPHQTRYVRALAGTVVGDARTVDARQDLGSDDFAFFAERVPSSYFVLGSSSDDRTSFAHHHPKFDIDESALAAGVELLTTLALDAPIHAP